MPRNIGFLTIPCDDGLVLGIEHEGQTLVQVCTPEMVAQLDSAIAKYKLGLGSHGKTTDVLKRMYESADNIPGAKAKLFHG